MSELITPEQFAEIWNSSSSVSEVASRVGRRRHPTSVKAARLRRLGLTLKKMPFHQMRSLAERLMEKVVKTEGCWLWTGSVTKKGYGQISQGRRGLRPIQVHVASYEIHVGPVPDDKCVLHECDTPNCIRPDHLFLGTEADNTHDMMRKGRGHWQENAPSKQPRKESPSK